VSDLEYWIAAIKDNVSPIQWLLGGVVGFFTSRWTLSKKDRLDAEQKLFENGRDLMVAQNLRYQEFTSALQKYVNKKEDPTVDDFVAIATSGDTYFHQLMISSNAVLGGKVSAGLRDDTLVPRIVEAVTSNLPGYYSTLQSIAAGKGFTYDGKLDRKKYEALYVVVEKFGRTGAVAVNFGADANHVDGTA
jgi:hypothetical protein